MMTLTIATVTLVVDTYDRALAYYCGVPWPDAGGRYAAGDGKRWVVVAGAGGARVVVARRSERRGAAGAIGNQTGGRVGFFMHRRFLPPTMRGLSRPVHLSRGAAPRSLGGTVAVFEDIYGGNGWDLIQPMQE